MFIYSFLYSHLFEIFTFLLVYLFIFLLLCIFPRFTLIYSFLLYLLTLFLRKIPYYLIICHNWWYFIFLFLFFSDVIVSSSVGLHIVTLSSRVEFGLRSHQCSQLHVHLYFFGILIRSKYLVFLACSYIFTRRT